MDFSIQWTGSPNFWTGREGNKPVAICNHITQGLEPGVTQTFQRNDPQNGVSAHFLVTRQALIKQFVKEVDSAWANGPVASPDPSIEWLGDAVHKGVNPNLLTLSIEHEGFTGQPLTEPQYQATLWLQKRLIQNWGIPVDRQHIIGHYQINLIDRPFCPGPAYPWNRLMQDLTPAPQHLDFPNSGGWIDNVTGFWVVPPLAAYYVNGGGLAEFGHPISGMTGDDTHYPGLVVQWFERARLEVHPDGTIMRGLVGEEAYQAIEGGGGAASA